MEENKYHFARELIYNLKVARAIDEKVYLFWIDKLIKDEKESKKDIHCINCYWFNNGVCEYNTMCFDYKYFKKDDIF